MHFAQEKSQGVICSNPREDRVCGDRSGRSGDSRGVWKIGARSSPLSRAQVEEVAQEMGIVFDVTWVETIGDKDKKTSLRTLDKTDFFTRELDDLLLAHKIDAAVHSAKDLPDPLPRGLVIAAITRGVDPRDCLVLRPRATLQEIRTIATSSERREQVVRSICPQAQVVDLRGTIGERLQLLFDSHVDGVVLAEAALIRLKLTHLHRVMLPGETAPLQGKLAVVVREQDLLAQRFFSEGIR